MPKLKDICEKQGVKLPEKMGLSTLVALDESEAKGFNACKALYDNIVLEEREELDVGKVLDFIHLYASGSLFNGHTEDELNLAKAICDKFSKSKVVVDEKIIEKEIKEYLDNYSDGYSIYDKKKLALIIKDSLEKDQ